MSSPRTAEKSEIKEEKVNVKEAPVEITWKNVHSFLESERFGITEEIQTIRNFGIQSDSEKNSAEFKTLYNLTAAEFQRSKDMKEYWKRENIDSAIQEFRKKRKQEQEQKYQPTPQDNALLTQILFDALEAQAKKIAARDARETELYPWIKKVKKWPEFFVTDSPSCFSCFRGEPAQRRSINGASLPDPVISSSTGTATTRPATVQTPLLPKLASRS